MKTLALVRVLALAVGLSCALPALAAETIIAQVSAAPESSHVFCDATGTPPVRKAPCLVRDFYVTTGGVAGWLMTFKTVAVPVNGVLDGTTTHEKPWECIAVAANQTVGRDLGEKGEPYVTGMTMAFSTTGCFTLTLSATAFFKASVQ